jgi:hypothetical protein
MNDLPFAQIMTLSLMPVANAVRSFFLRIQLRNTEYILAQIAETRRNDTLVEQQTHRRQALLNSRLRQLEPK